MDVSGPLQLVWVANLTHDSDVVVSGLPTWAWEWKAACSFWLTFVGIVTYIVVLASASYGLVAFWNMPVGVVPAYLAIIQVLLCLDSSGISARLLGTLVAWTAFLSLSGAPVALSLDRDSLVWILYTALAPSAMYKLRIIWSGDFVMQALVSEEIADLDSTSAFVSSILISTLVGMALDQPALYFIGLVACIWSTLLLLWYSMDPEYEYFFMPLGALGATTVGFHLKRHGTCLAFYIKRAVMRAWAESVTTVALLDSPHDAAQLLPGHLRRT
jgi:hypothetical protein